MQRRFSTFNSFNVFQKVTVSLTIKRKKIWHKLILEMFFELKGWFKKYENLFPKPIYVRI